MSPLRATVLTLSTRSRAVASFYFGGTYYGFRYAGCGLERHPLLTASPATALTGAAAHPFAHHRNFRIESPS